MNSYEVEVPVYLQVRVRAHNPIAAEEAAERLVAELAESATAFDEEICPEARSAPCAYVSATKLVLLDEGEDRKPDVYDITPAGARGIEEGRHIG